MTEDRRCGDCLLEGQEGLFKRFVPWELLSFPEQLVEWLDFFGVL